MTGVRVLNRDDVEAALDMASCVDACERAFAAYSTGGAELPGVIHLDVPESHGEVHIKAGHVHGFPYYALKAASGFAPPGGTAAIDGVVLVFDSANGSPAAILLDGGLLTDVRTGAAGGVAARHLAAASVSAAAVLGTGIQARAQVDALRAVHPELRSVAVWGRNADRARELGDDLRTRDLEVRIAGSPREAVDGGHVVMTCTASREPLIRADWLTAGSLVIAVGSDGEGKQELDPDVLERADALVVDSLEQSGRIGELQHAAAKFDRAVELGLICAGRAPGRTSEDQLIVCDLTGVGVQDVAAANVVMERSADRGRVLEI